MGLPCKIPPSTDETLRIGPRDHLPETVEHLRVARRKNVCRLPDYLNLGTCGSGRFGGGPGHGGYCGFEGPLYEPGMMKMVARDFTEQFVDSVDIVGAIQSRGKRISRPIVGARRFQRCQLMCEGE